MPFAKGKIGCTGRMEPDQPEHGLQSSSLNFINRKPGVMQEQGFIDDISADDSKETVFPVP